MARTKKIVKKTSPKKTSPKKTPPKTSPKGKSTKRVWKPRTYGTYIHRVLKQVHPSTNIKQTSTDQIDQINKVIIDKFRDESIKLLEISHKVTVDSRTIQNAARTILPGQLAKHAVSEGSKAITKFNASTSGPKSGRAGLTYPIGLTRKLLTMEEMRSKVFSRVGQGSAIYLAAVLEYLTAEILELAGNVARDLNKATITPKHIYMAVFNDEELKMLFDSLGIVMTDTPVMSGVANALLFTPAEKKKRAAERAKKRSGEARKKESGGRFKVPGEKALQDVKKVQQKTGTVLPKIAFSRLAREIISDFHTDLRFNVEAMNMLQRGMEDHMVKLYRAANALAIHADRRSVQPKDMHLARTISNPRMAGNLEPSDGYKKE